jgi:tyrosinase
MIQSLILASVAFATNCVNPETFKEWRELTHWERKGYVQSIACLAKKPSEMNNIKFGVPIHGKPAKPKSRLDDFTYGRSRSHYEIPIIFHPQYLPWNRVFLRLFDAALRKCGYQGALPYWDLSINGLQAPEIWQYFGTDRRGYVSNPLLEGTLKCSIPDKHEVRRLLSSPKGAAAFSKEKIADSMKLPDYNGFRLWIEEAQRNLLATFTGDLENLATEPNDPIFYLLQRNVDRIWYMWQKENPTIAYSGSGRNPGSPNDSMSFVGLYPRAVIVQEALDSKSGGVDGLMCFEYSNSITLRPATPANNIVPFRRF